MDCHRPEWLFKEPFAKPTSDAGAAREKGSSPGACSSHAFSWNITLRFDIVEVDLKEITSVMKCSKRNDYFQRYPFAQSGVN